MADRARSFGSLAADYATHRPDYPADAIRWALAGATGPVLDLAAGTGKRTAGPLSLGFAVTAVEPDDEMRAELTRRFPRVEALTGTAEAIPLDDGSVGAVRRGAGVPLVRPGGGARRDRAGAAAGGAGGLLWNGEDAGVEWVAGMTSELSTVPEHESFAVPEVAEFPNTQRRTVDSLAATLGTHSRMIVMPADERADVLARVRAYLRGRPETAGGEFDVPLVTKVVRAVRR